MVSKEGEDDRKIRQWLIELYKAAKDGKSIAVTLISSDRDFNKEIMDLIDIGAKVLLVHDHRVNQAYLKAIPTQNRVLWSDLMMSTTPMLTNNDLHEPKSRLTYPMEPRSISPFSRFVVGRFGALSSTILHKFECTLEVISASACHDLKMDLEELTNKRYVIHVFNAEEKMKTVTRHFKKLAASCHVGALSHEEAILSIDGIDRVIISQCIAREHAEVVMNQLRMLLQRPLHNESWNIFLEGPMGQVTEARDWLTSLSASLVCEAFKLEYTCANGSTKEPFNISTARNLQKYIIQALGITGASDDEDENHHDGVSKDKATTNELVACPISTITKNNMLIYVGMGRAEDLLPEQRTRDDTPIMEIMFSKDEWIHVSSVIELVKV